MGAIDDARFLARNDRGDVAVNAYGRLARLASKPTSGLRLLTGLRPLNRKPNQPD